MFEKLKNFFLSNRELMHIMVSIVTVSLLLTGGLYVFNCYQLQQQEGKEHVEVLLKK